MPLAATEHRGVVKFGGLPVPGVTVTASQGDKKLTAVTDDQGVYTFPNLSDGLWNIQVEMQCFETIKREIAVAPDAPGPRMGSETPVLRRNQSLCSGACAFRAQGCRNHRLYHCGLCRSYPRDALYRCR